MGVIVQNLNYKAQGKDISDKEIKVFHRKIEKVCIVPIYFRYRRCQYLKLMWKAMFSEKQHKSKQNQNCQHEVVSVLIDQVFSKGQYKQYSNPSQHGILPWARLVGHGQYYQVHLQARRCLYLWPSLVSFSDERNPQKALLLIFLWKYIYFNVD